MPLLKKRQAAQVPHCYSHCNQQAKELSRDFDSEPSSNSANRDCARQEERNDKNFLKAIFTAARLTSRWCRGHGPCSSLTEDAGKSDSFKHKVTQHTAQAEWEQQLKAGFRLDQCHWEPQADHARVFTHRAEVSFSHRGSLTFWSPPALKALRRKRKEKKVHVSAQSKLALIALQLRKSWLLKSISCWKGFPTRDNNLKFSSFESTMIHFHKRQNTFGYIICWSETVGEALHKVSKYELS